MQMGEFKSSGGLIRVQVEVKRGKIGALIFTGDFFVYPEKILNKLEQELKGTKIESKKLNEKVQKFYVDSTIESPLLKPEHWVEAIERALEGDE